MFDPEPWVRAIIVGIWPFLWHAYIAHRDARLEETYRQYREEIIYGPERERDYWRRERWIRGLIK